MGKLTSWNSLRTIGENAFEALILLGTVAYVLGATISICLAGQPS
jgi:hypothetical protein